MSGSSWKATVSSGNDPLAGFHKKPMISRGGPNATYVGRVIIELWEDPGARDDAGKMTIVPDAVDGRHAELLERIAAALPILIQRGNPLRQSAPPTGSPAPEGTKGPQ